MPHYRGEPWYDIAQICVNGHVVNDAVKARPQHDQKFCDKCGAETTTACKECSTSIRGEFHNPNSRILAATIPAPPFCHECGKPYPWTESRLEAARDLADQLGLDVPERTLLEKSIYELLRDTPKAPAEAVRFREIVSHAKDSGLEAFRQVLYNVMSEPVRKMIWP